MFLHSSPDHEYQQDYVQSDRDEKDSAYSYGCYKVDVSVATLRRRHAHRNGSYRPTWLTQTYDIYVL